MMDATLNLVRREVGRVLSRLGLPRCGTVTAYDPNTHSAKVLLHPEDVETGWLPIRTPWSGNGWGMFCPPTPGDEVTVNFQEGGKQAGFVTLRAFGDRFRPLPVPSGEFWLVHKSGSQLRFLNDGTVEIVSAVQINSTAPLWHHVGDFLATGSITDVDGLYGSVGYLREQYDLHRHDQVQNGNGVSGLTDRPV